MQNKVTVNPFNPNENMYIDAEGNLFIDGASYIKGMDDYEWNFALSKKNFLKLLEHLSHHPLHPGYEPLDVPDGCEPSEIIIDAIIKMGKDAGDLHALCNRHKIPHYFTTWR